jgi:murein DD-endopeptidase MepM/ murein hydrolase activator NlpD
MRGYFKKKFFALLIALIFVVPIFPVGASPTTQERLRDLQQQQRAAGHRVSEQSNILAGTEAEMSRVTAEIQALDQQIVDASDALDAIEIDLLTTELRISETQNDLVLATAERDLQMEILRERVRTMHEQGSAGFIEILFNAEDIRDFFSRLEYIRAVTQFDRDLLSRLEASEERLTANRNTLTSDRSLIQDLQKQITLAKEEIEQRMEERQIFFSLLYADAEKQRELEILLREEAHAINIELGRVQAIHRAELAEAERIRRAEEDARRAAEAEARRIANEATIATLPPFTGQFAWPVPARPHTNPRNISSPFGNRPDPFTGRETFHAGIDIPAPSGTNIVAAEAGVVRFAGHSVSYGNYIIIDHANNYSTLYAHNSRNRVTTGQTVTKGQHIGDVGTTGRSTGNHLHFEIRRNGDYRNPMSYFGG